MKKLKIVPVVILCVGIITLLTMCSKTKNDIRNSPSEINYSSGDVTAVKNGDGGRVTFGWSVGFKAGHKTCIGDETCIDFSCYPMLCFKPCHIPCVNYGEECEHTFSIGFGMVNLDSSHYDGSTAYTTFNSSQDSLFLAPDSNAPDPIMNTFKSFSIDTATTGLTNFINIPTQTTRLKYTTDSLEFYIVRGITYSPTPAYSVY